jgi:predicted transcriptional regulator
VRQSIERGLADAEAGRVIPHEEVLARVLRSK